MNDNYYIIFLSSILKMLIKSLLPTIAFSVALGASSGNIDNYNNEKIAKEIISLLMNSEELGLHSDLLELCQYFEKTIVSRLRTPAELQIGGDSEDYNFVPFNEHKIHQSDGEHRLAILSKNTDEGYILKFFDTGPLDFSFHTLDDKLVGAEIFSKMSDTKNGYRVMRGPISSFVSKRKEAKSFLNSRVIEVNNLSRQMDGLVRKLNKREQRKFDAEQRKVSRYRAKMR